MNSLFLRFLLWIGGGFVLMVVALVAVLRLQTPNAFATQWIRVGRGALVSLGRSSVEIHERDRAREGARRLESLARDLGVQASLFDLSGRCLMGPCDMSAAPVLAALAKRPDGELVFLSGPMAGLTVRGAEASYVFVARLPPRPGRWSRGFLASLLLTGGIVSYVLARQLTSSIVRLRSVTSRFAGGDLAARVTDRPLLARRDEIGGLIRDFNHMASRIEDLMTAQRRLLADVSHELRSPLTRLRLGLGLMRQRIPVDAHVTLARMERDVGRLDRLIGQVLALSRLESLGPPPLEPVDLAALVTEIADDADFEARSTERRVRIVECAPCVVQGARDLLRSAIENTVRNAVHYTEPRTEVQMRLSLDRDAGARIVVEDHGPGVPPRDLAHLFEPFHRLDETRGRNPGGAGLGLAITRRVVTLHGGSVSAANRVEGGLAVEITLPLADTGARSDT